MKYIVTAKVTYDCTFAVESDPEDTDGREKAIRGSVNYLTTNFGGFGSNYGWFDSPEMTGRTIDEATEDDDRYQPIPAEKLT